MATHILWQADVADFDAWHAVFDRDAPARKAAGLKTLHVWQDADVANHAFVLFQVLDLDRAKAFFDSEELAMHLERDGIAHIATKMLKPA